MTRLDQSTVESLISRVQKPGRYMGREFNVIVKDKALVRMAISYPDLYEVGMSNNGLRILYDIVNMLPDVACERVFAVAADFEQNLRASKIPLYTLETYTPLHELDILGFNLSHELLCTNVLQVLELGRVPLRRTERGERDPIVIAGGEAVSNPFPMSDFIDAFYIGDGEEGIVDIARAVLSAKGRNLARSAILESIASVEGVLMPSWYRITYNGCGVADMTGPVVQKRVYRGRGLVDPRKPLVPNIRITQERIVIEVTRGCGNLCNFCHAGYYDLPYRFYDPSALAGRIFEIVQNSGYQKVTFSSLSISDYPHLTALVNAAIPALTEKGISVSLPSLRVDKATLPFIEQISELRRASLTFAVESASDDILARANKRLVTQDLLDIVLRVSGLGWKVIKLYFMIGLPECEKHDEAGDIIKLLKDVHRIGGKGLDINVTVSPFVPKPHTPFQRTRQMSRGYFENSIAQIKRNLPRSIRIKSHDVKASILEGLIARGDVRLGPVIMRSYRQGCRFDSWEEHFRFDIWQTNLDDALPGWERFLDTRADDVLPWSFINTGFERLIEKGRVSDRGVVEADESPHQKRGAIDAQGIEEAKMRFSRRFDVKKRIRMRFVKIGMMRFIPHIDFMEIVKRGLRMADAPVAMSRGFNKRERISAGFPLPLGIESEAELVDAELFDDLPGDFSDRLSSCLPAGISIADVHYIDRKESLMAIASVVEYRITTDREELLHAIEQNLEAGVAFIKKAENLERKIPHKAVMHSYELSNHSSLLVRLYAGTVDSVRIDHVVGILSGMGDDDREAIRIVKTAQYIRINGTLEPIV